MERQERLQHVIQQLGRLSDKRTGPSGSTFVRCPFHNEKTPSFRIFHSVTTRVPGYGKCYGCGQSGAWDTFAEVLGLEPYAQGKPITHYANVVSKVDKKPEREYTLSKLPKGKFWRGISTNLLRKVGCKMYTCSEYGTKYIYLPVIVNGEVKGYSRGRLRKREGYTSYLNSPGDWTRRYGLFPFDYAIKKAKNKTVVLVEGQRDALRLLSLGIPAMCIMGTQSWSEYKVSLLELHGIERVVIMMDGDRAGIQATQTAIEYLEGLLDYVVIKLWHIKGSPYRKYRHLDDEEIKPYKHLFWDPGNCPESVLKEIKRRYIK